MSDTNQPLIVPIAHYVGEMHIPGKESVTHKLRGGWGIVELTDSEMTLWLLAHSTSEAREAGKPWTRKAVLEAVPPEVTDADRIIDDLLSKDVLAEVTPGTEQAVEFASKYRLVPLMWGLGNTHETPWEYRIGILGHPLLAVNSTVYDTWEWSHLYRSLWASCQSLAKLRETHDERPAEERDPRGILNQVVLSLHALLGFQCAYLDVPFEWGKP